MTALDLTLPSPEENISRDEQLLDAAENGTGGEILRFWESRDYFVVVGYANKIETEVNVAACEARKIPILRRCSGGGTVVQGPGCLNYALILKITGDGPLRTITAANKFIMARNLAAIKSTCNLQPATCNLAIQGCTDMTLNGVKFSGNAQRRRRHHLLFHGTFLLNFDLAIISELLPMPSREPDYRESRPHAAFLTNLNLNADQVKPAMREVWSK